MQLTTTHKEAVTCSCYNTSFNHVVTSSEGSVIKVWDIENGDQVFEYSDVHDQTSVTDMCFDSTQRRSVIVWNMKRFSSLLLCLYMQIQHANFVPEHDSSDVRFKGPNLKIFILGTTSFNTPFVNF